jgi:2-polyprenyl-3-methyl-5-hydroxy-6-metoxy-1,4-benzoquinol methylase
MRDIPSFGDLYRRFEDRFRGDFETIRQRQTAYLPLIGLVDAERENGRCALDLGAGRGEWLRLAADHGWSAVGVDSNPSMIEASRASGIEIVEMDALDFLRQAPDAAYGLVTSFHLAEHLEMDQLIAMLFEIERVLIPGGIVIIETPNPENLTVASWSFHLDPTHKRPLPPPLLQFLVGEASLQAPQIVRLNSHAIAGADAAQGSALAALFTASPDYGVVATKGIEDPARLQSFQETTAAIGQRNPSDLVSILADIQALQSVVGLLGVGGGSAQGLAAAIERLSKGHEDICSEIARVRAGHEALWAEVNSSQAASIADSLKHIIQRLDEVHAAQLRRSQRTVEP